MNAEAALGRIALLLERQGADSYRVAAFRRALRTVSSLDPDELLAAVATGRLERLEGIGATTAEVISQAVRGEKVSYLERLEAVPEQSFDKKALALLDELKGDCHSHSDWSDGGSPIEEMATAAKAIGREYLVLTDHSPRLTVARGLSAERLEQQLEVLDELNKTLAPFRLLSGIEVDILDDGSLDQSDELLGRLDVVVASVHSKLKMDAPAMTRRMVQAVSNPLVDVLGHCTGRLITGKGRPPSSFDANEVFSACAGHHTAVEINSRIERRDPPKALLELANSLGCVFSIDSDAHAPGQLEWLIYGCEQAIEAGIDSKRIINTWPATRLLAWTNESDESR